MLVTTDNVEGGQRRMSGDKGIVFKGRTCGSSGDWLFYQDEQYKLHKIKTDGSSGLKICEDTMMFVNIDSNWIYYSCLNDNRNIYRISHDGRERYKLHNDEAWWLCLADEWLYYINHSDSRNIYRINFKGQNNESLQLGSASQLSTTGDVLYFASDSDQGKAYWLQLTGGIPEKISDDQAESLQQVGDYFYYINPGEERSIFRIKKDGSCRQKLLDEKAEDLKAGGELLYFVNISEGRKVYSMDTDGNMLKEITDCRAEALFATCNRLYYSDLDHGGLIRFLDVEADESVSERSDAASASGILQGTRGLILKSKFIAENAGELFFFDNAWLNIKPSGSIVKLSQDGSICEKLNNVRAEHPIIVENWIYFINQSDDNKIYKMKTDGSLLTRLSKRDCGYEPIGYSDGWLYFSKDGIYRLHTENKVSTKIFDARAAGLKVFGEWVFFINYAADSKLCRVKTDGTDYSELTTEKVMSSGYRIYKEWLFYFNIGRQRSTYRIRFDGSEKTDIGCGDNLDFVIEDDWIYYLKISGGQNESLAEMFDALAGKKITNKERALICKVKIDGSCQSLIHDCATDNLRKNGDWLYYVNYDDGARIYRINIDGTRNVRINNENSRCLYANDEWVFYSSIDDRDKLCKIKIDGSERAVVEYDLK